MKTALLILILGLSLDASGRLPPADTAVLTLQHAERPHKALVRGIAFLPARIHRVEGLTLSIFTKRKNQLPLRITGLNIDVMPLGLILAPLVLIYGLIAVLKKHDYNTDTLKAIYARRVRDTPVSIKGIDFRAFGGEPAAALTGLGVAGGGNAHTVLRGVAVSALSNVAEQLQGLQLAVWSNHADAGRGLQISLFNHADLCQCLQVGLLNRNGKRLLPFVNWRRRVR